MRVKVDVEVNNPLMVGFWWTNSQGVEKWVMARPSLRAEANPLTPAYGPWLIGARPKFMTSSEKQRGEAATVLQDRKQEGGKLGTRLWRWRKSLKQASEQKK